MTDHTAIADLVDGFEAIADAAIPYARLPKRVHSVFAAEFVRWADLGGESVKSLLGRPKAGAATVSALLGAAAEAVAAQRDAASTHPRVGATAAIEQMIAQLDQRDRALLSARYWSSAPQSQGAVAGQLGVSKASVQRNEPRARMRLAEIVDHPAHHEVRESVEALRERLGVYAPADVAAAALGELGVDPSSETVRVLLYLAGPYVAQDAWVENSAAGGRSRIAAAVQAAFRDDLGRTTASLTRSLVAAGMTSDVVVRYLSGLAWLRRFGDVWVRWGDSAADKAEAVLHVRGEALTIPEVFEEVGDDLTLRSVQNALYGDDRFIRTGPRTWGLSAWGAEAYSGVLSELVARIDAAGGRMSVERLVGDMRAAFPDTPGSTIRSYLNTLAFIIDDDVVRCRTDTDDWPPVEPLNRARGAFRGCDNKIRFAVPVTPELLRGSGCRIARGVAYAFGVGPGERRTFDTPYGAAVLTWRLSSVNGPATSSLRAAAVALDAAPGDTLLLVFRPDEPALTFERIGAGVSGWERLAGLLGTSVPEADSALPAGLDCERDEVVAVLRARGDDEFADLVRH